MNHAPPVRGGLRAAALALALLAAAAPAADAGEPVAMRWRLAPGRVLRYSLDQRTVHESRPEGGRPLRVERRQRLDFRLSVSRVDEGGAAADLALVVDRARVEIDGAGAPVDFAFDTNAPDAPVEEGPFAARLVALLNGLVGAEIDLRMDDRGEVSDVRIPEPLLGLIRRAGEQGAAVAFSEEGVRNLALQAFPLLPPGPVEPGASWTRQATAPMPTLGAMALDKTYTYRGPRPGSPRLLQVDVDTRLSLRPAPEATLEMKLLRQSATGSFTFDAGAGVVAEHHLEDDLAASFTAGGPAVERSLSSRIDVVLAPEGDAPESPAPERRTP